MAASTVPALKKALMQQLQARPGLSGVQISYGSPSGTPNNDLIIIGNAQPHTAVAAALGHMRLDERYTLNIRIVSQATGTDQETQTERCFAIAEEIRSQLVSDPKVNNCGVQWALPAGNPHLEPSTETQLAPEVRLRVNCMARI